MRLFLKITAFSRIRQHGLALSFILLTIAIIFALAVSLALASRDRVSLPRPYETELHAATILNQGQNYLSTFETKMAEAVAAEDITFDGNLLTGLNRHPQLPYVQALEPSLGATTWLYEKAAVSFMNLGTAAGDYAVVLPHLRDEVCSVINEKLWGSPAIPKLAANPGANRANWYGNAAGTNIINLTADPAVNGRHQGCVEFPDENVNFYYHVLLIR